MLRKTFITIGALLAFLGTRAQHWDWFQTGQGVPNGILQTSNIIADRNGSVVSLFSFSDTVAVGNLLFSAINSGSSCIVRYDTAGQLIHAFTIPVWGKQLGISADGDYLICGFFTDTLFWENQLLIPDGPAAAFIAKTDTTGNLRWVKKIESPGAYPHSITGGSDGKIYVAGAYSQSFAFAGDSVIHAGTIDWDGVLLIFDSSGQELAFKTTTGRTAEYFTRVIINDSGTIALAGVYGYSCQFASDSFSSYFDSAHITHYDHNFMPGFVAVYNNDLSLRWVKQSAASDIAFDSQENLIAVGSILGNTFTLDDTLTLQNPQYNTSQCLIIKYKPSGERIWWHFFGGVSSDRLDNVEIVSGDRILVMGTFTDSLLFSGNPVLYGFFETFWGCFDQHGNSLWMNIQATALFENPGWLVKGSTEDCFIAASCYLSFSLQKTMQIIVPSNAHVFLIARLKLTGSNNTIPDPSPIEGTPLLYPNPGSGMFYIQSNTWRDKTISLTIWDAAGRKCISSELPPSALHPLYISEFPAGIYQITLSDQTGENVYLRLVKTN
jgi:Secretion system C-terminal sorting domain